MILNSPLHAASHSDLVAQSGSSRCTEYLLVCDAKSTSLDEGRWHFSLETADGTPVFDAGDVDFGDLNRLTLLASVRGLEAIDGAASVTLLSNSRYLIRSLSDSLPRWRDNGFVWEHFGSRVEVQHADLWRRMDGALSIHRVEACLVSTRLVSVGSGGTAGSPSSRDDGLQHRIDAPHSRAPSPHLSGPQGRSGSPRRRSTGSRSSLDRLPATTDRLRRMLMGSEEPTVLATNRIVSSPEPLESS